MDVKAVVDKVLAENITSNGKVDIQRLSKNIQFMTQTINKDVIAKLGNEYQNFARLIGFDEKLRQTMDFLEY